MPALLPTDEARRLAAYLTRVARPQTPADRDEFDYWIAILTAKETRP